jgi:hypothetical protein
MVPHKTHSQRETALLAPLNGQSVPEAASAVGIGGRTLRRWMTEDEEFRAQYDAARQTLFADGIARIEGLAPRAADVLGQLLSPDTPPNVRLGAVRLALEVALRERDAKTILKRLEEIEAELAQR